jgi:hypothetical protein
MKQVIYSLLFASVAGALTFGAAASLPVTGGGSLGSAVVEVKSCDENGVDLQYELAPDDYGIVEALVIAGIDEECSGEVLHYTVTDLPGDADGTNGDQEEVLGPWLGSFEIAGSAGQDDTEHEGSKEDGSGHDGSEEDGSKDDGSGEGLTEKITLNGGAGIPVAAIDEIAITIGGAVAESESK